MGEIRIAHKILVHKPERKRPVRIPKCRCEDDIKLDLKVICVRMGTGFIWLRIEILGGLL
jgi:hypothetical protein